MTEPTPGPGWILRPCRPEDAETVLGLFHALDVVEFGAEEAELVDVTSTLESSGRCWLAAADGNAVGFCHTQSSGECDTVVDPAFDTALRPALIRQVLEDGRSLGVGTLEHWAGVGMRLTGSALEPFGFRHARSSWELRRESTDLPTPTWPDGVALTPFDREQAEQVWALVTRAFAGGGFSHGRPLQEWTRLFLDDATDVLCARRDGALVGAAILSTRLQDAYVRQLAVADSERGHGLGRTLLLEAFARAAAAGRPGTSLGVDGANDGARRLYDSVGMTVVREYWRWDLDL